MRGVLVGEDLIASDEVPSRSVECAMDSNSLVVELFLPKESLDLANSSEICVGAGKATVYSDVPSERARSLDSVGAVREGFNVIDEASYRIPENASDTNCIIVELNNPGPDMTSDGFGDVDTNCIIVELNNSSPVTADDLGDADLLRIDVGNSAGNLLGFDSPAKSSVAIDGSEVDDAVQAVGGFDSSKFEILLTSNTVDIEPSIVGNSPGSQESAFTRLNNESEVNATDMHSLRDNVLPSLQDNGLSDLELPKQSAGASLEGQRITMRVDEKCCVLLGGDLDSSEISTSLSEESKHAIQESVQKSHSMLSFETNVNENKMIDDEEIDAHAPSLPMEDPFVGDFEKKDGGGEIVVNIVVEKRGNTEGEVQESIDLEIVNGDGTAQDPTEDLMEATWPQLAPEVFQEPFVFAEEKIDVGVETTEYGGGFSLKDSEMEEAAVPLQPLQALHVPEPFKEFVDFVEDIIEVGVETTDLRGSIFLKDSMEEGTVPQFASDSFQEPVVLAKDTFEVGIETTEFTFARVGTVSDEVVENIVDTDQGVLIGVGSRIEMSGLIITEIEGYGTVTDHLEMTRSRSISEPLITPPTEGETGDTSYDNRLADDSIVDMEDLVVAMGKGDLKSNVTFNSSSSTGPDIEVIQLPSDVVVTEEAVRGDTELEDVNIDALAEPVLVAPDKQGDLVEEEGGCLGTRELNIVTRTLEHFSTDLTELASIVEPAKEETIPEMNVAITFEVLSEEGQRDISPGIAADSVLEGEDESSRGQAQWKNDRKRGREDGTLIEESNEKTSKTVKSSNVETVVEANVGVVDLNPEDEKADKKRPRDSQDITSIELDSSQLNKKSFKTEIDDRGKEECMNKNIDVVAEKQSTQVHDVKGQDSAVSRYKKRKIALFLGYCGASYQGMQKNPGAVTIEGELEEALFRSGAIAESNYGNPRKLDWRRAARTDKGVSAVGQVVSGTFFIDPPGLVERLNSHLPKQIRVYGYKRVTPSFNARNLCDRRKYEYVVPVYAFDPTVHLDRESSRAKTGFESVEIHPENLGATAVEISSAGQDGTPMVIANAVSDGNGIVTGVESFDGLENMAELATITRNLPVSSEDSSAASPSNVSQGEAPPFNEVSPSVLPTTCDSTEANPPVLENGIMLTPAVAEKNALDVDAKLVTGTNLAPVEMETIPETEGTVNENTELMMETDAELEGEMRLTEEERKQALDEKVRSSTFKFGDEASNRLNRILRSFEGHHNFHNFTARVSADDPSANRYVLSFKAEDVFTADGIEFVRCTIVGQSFMLNQIRKMIGLAVAIMRGYVPESYVHKALRRDTKVNVPMAPALGLFLEECFYSSYNTRWHTTHEEVSLNPYTKDVEELKRDFIYPHISSTEAKESTFALWLHSLNDRHFPDFIAARSDSLTTAV